MRKSSIKRTKIKLVKIVSGLIAGGVLVSPAVLYAQNTSQNTAKETVKLTAKQTQLAQQSTQSIQPPSVSPSVVPVNPPTPKAAQVTTTTQVTTTNAKGSEAPATLVTPPVTQPVTPPPAPSNKPNTNATTSTITTTTTAVTNNSKMANMQQQTQDLVKKTQDYIKANGKEAALKELNKANNAFSSGNLYVFAMDYQGTLLAETNTPDLVGKILSNVQDPDGTYFAKNLIEKAKSGGGWVLYRYPNPATKKTDCKNTYVFPANSDYLIAAGYYFPENPTTHKCEPQ